MASWEMKLIARILEEKKIDGVIQSGVTPNMLKIPLCKEILNFMLDHRAKYLVLPTADLVRTKFDDYKHFVPEEPLESICDVITESLLREELNKGLLELSEVSSNSPRAAVGQLQQMLAKVTKWNLRTEDINFADYAKNFKPEYEQYKITKGMIGLPYPWPILNKASGGICPEQLVTLYGTFKSCKSWLLLYTACHLYQTEQNSKILVVSKEMTPVELARRCIAIIARIPYGLLKSGSLSEEKEGELFELLQEVALGMGSKLVLSDARSTRGEIDLVSIEQKIEQLSPNMVFVDGAYLIGDGRQGDTLSSRDTERFTNITRGLKDMAQRTKLPIMITSQANRYGDARSKSSGLGFSVSVGQDSDCLIRIFRHHKKNEIAVRVDGLREGEEPGFTIYCNVADNFTVKSNTITKIDDYIAADMAGSTTKFDPDRPLTQEEQELRDIVQNPGQKVFKRKYHQTAKDSSAEGRGLAPTIPSPLSGVRRFEEVAGDLPDV